MDNACVGVHLSSWNKYSSKLEQKLGGERREKIMYGLHLKWLVFRARPTMEKNTIIAYILRYSPPFRPSICECVHIQQHQWSFVMSSRSFVRWLVCLPISSNKHTRTSEVGLKSLSVRACACGCERVRFQSVYIFSEQSIVYCGHLRIFRTYACKSINKLVRSILREKSTCVWKISATKFIVRCSTCV